MAQFIKKESLTQAQADAKFVTWGAQVHKVESPRSRVYTVPGMGRDRFVRARIEGNRIVVEHYSGCPCSG
jgi:hypothetical protein